MQNRTVEAIILGRKNWGEADRLVFAYTKEYGKIKFIAKGSRKIKSKMANHIEPFTIGKYYLVDGKNLPILIGAESLKQNINLSNNLDIFNKAAYVIELIDLATEEGIKNDDLFNTSSLVLSLLDTIDQEKQNILIIYLEYLVLESSGYKPNYMSCKVCGEKIKECDYFFGSFEGVHCDDCENSGIKISKNIFKILRIFETKNIDKILAIKNIKKYEEDLTKVISHYLYGILPKIPRTKKDE